MSTAGQIRGLDLLDETTVVLEDNQAAEFVRATLSAIFVQNGLMSLVAVAKCRIGVYRTMLSLRISSELGNYQPYPGRHPSSSRFLTCSRS